MSAHRDPDEPGMNDFESRLDAAGEDSPRAIELRSLVVSVTLHCNQSCTHCHVRSSPRRHEAMSAEVMARVVEVAAELRPDVVDITGGAPESNADLPEFLRALRDSGLRVQLRTNLTALALPEYAALADVFAASDVELLASMPCYTDRNVSVVRGAGVRDTSVDVLQRLNAIGYGVEGGRRLDLIYNPVGTTLPEPQADLDALFHEELWERFGIAFSRLLTMTNMPVGRFKDTLVAEGGYDRYLRALTEAFNPDVVPLLGCRHQIEVGWDGRLYDCDFNLGARRVVASGSPPTIWDFDAESLASRRIAYAAHCFGCTAGAGSS